MTTLAELRQLAKDITPGPWRFDDGCAPKDRDGEVIKIGPQHTESTHNRQLIAEAPELLCELIRVRENLDLWSDELHRLYLARKMVRPQEMVARIIRILGGRA